MYTQRKFRSPVAASTAALVVVLGFSGCKSKPTGVDDATLSASLQSRLQSDAGLAGQPVQSTVQEGVATLSGNVTNEAARSLAANDAAEVKGIRTVVNNLQLVPVTAPIVTAGRHAETKIAPPVRPYNPPAIPPAPVVRRDASNNQSNDSQPYAPPSRPPAAPAFRNVTVPAGTGLSVRITETLDSASTQAGSSFTGVLASDVIVDGAVAFPAGTRVTGRVDDAKDAGHFSGSSLLAVSLTGLSRRGENLGISTDTFTKEGKGRGKNTAEKVGGGAAVGAILGGIFGGGKGAAIGAGAGGGLGAGANGVTRGEQVQIPSESLIRFRLASAVTVRASTQSDNDNNDLRRHDQ